MIHFNNSLLILIEMFLFLSGSFFCCLMHLILDIFARVRLSCVRECMFLLVFFCAFLNSRSSLPIFKIFLNSPFNQIVFCIYVRTTSIIFMKVSQRIINWPNPDCVTPPTPPTPCPSLKSSQLLVLRFHWPFIS